MAASTAVTAGPDLDRIAPGSRVIVRDLVWQVTEVARHSLADRAVVRCVGQSELVAGQRAAFFSDLDRIEPEDPTNTRFVLDTSARGLRSRLVLESRFRRTPVPVSHTEVTVADRALADPLSYQLAPFRQVAGQLQPRLLVADSVGLGKTVEVGHILAELQRRGRAGRVLAVVPRHILDQVQHELWCRFAFPLVRLDSEGIQRMRRRIPVGQNPFAYFNRVIISIDTLKQPTRYRPLLEKVRWDVVWLDESHKVMNAGTQAQRLAEVLAPQADAFLLSSATPHNGKPESFAQLISLLDPVAVPDPKGVAPADVAPLVVRRTKHSEDVRREIGHCWAERREPITFPVTPTTAEEAVFAELSSTWLDPEVPPPLDDRKGKANRLFPYTLLKAALSSPVALADTVRSRQQRRVSEHGEGGAEAKALARLAELLRVPEQWSVDDLVDALERGAS